jgi:hypothetical protein
MVPGTDPSRQRLSGTFEEEHIMAARNPNDPREPFLNDDTHRANDPYRPIDPTRPDLENDGLLRASRVDNDLQADPELAEGPASSIKIAIGAVAVAVLLGAVFYGLNTSTTHQNGTSTTAQNTAPLAPKASPGGNPAGTTTGSAPSQTSPPPAPPAPANK